MSPDPLISRATLEAEPWPAYLIDREGTVSYVNQAWDLVAKPAQGPLACDVVGTPWLDWIAGDELRSWHQSLFDRLMRRTSGDSFECDCNTPDRYRLFAVRFESLARPGATEPEAVLQLTSMLEDAPIAERYPIGPPDEARFRQPEGVILQCGGCRRVKVAGPPTPVWEYVPEWVVTPRQDISHGICEVCREVHYGMLRRAR